MHGRVREFCRYKKCIFEFLYTFSLCWFRSINQPPGKGKLNNNKTISPNEHHRSTLDNTVQPAGFNVFVFQHGKSSNTHSISNILLNFCLNFAQYLYLEAQLQLELHIWIWLVQCPVQRPPASIFIYIFIYIFNCQNIMKIVSSSQPLHEFFVSAQLRKMCKLSNLRIYWCFIYIHS